MQANKIKLNMSFPTSYLFDDTIENFLLFIGFSGFQINKRPKKEMKGNGDP